MCLQEYVWSADRGEVLFPGNDHIVMAAGTMDDEDIAAFIPTGDDPHMGVVGVEYQIAGKCICPGDCRAFLCNSRRKVW